MSDVLDDLFTKKTYLSKMRSDWRLEDKCRDIIASWDENGIRTIAHFLKLRDERMKATGAEAAAICAAESHDIINRLTAELDVERGLRAFAIQQHERGEAKLAAERDAASIWKARAAEAGLRAEGLAGLLERAKVAMLDGDDYVNEYLANEITAALAAMPRKE